LFRAKYGLRGARFLNVENVPRPDFMADGIKGKAFLNRPLKNVI